MSADIISDLEAQMEQMAQTIEAMKRAETGKKIREKSKPREEFTNKIFTEDKQDWEQMPEYSRVPFPQFKKGWEEAWDSDPRLLAWIEKEGEKLKRKSEKKLKEIASEVKIESTTQEEKKIQEFTQDHQDTLDLLKQTESQKISKQNQTKRKRNVKKKEKKVPSPKVNPPPLLTEPKKKKKKEVVEVEADSTKGSAKYSAEIPHLVALYEDWGSIIEWCGKAEYSDSQIEEQLGKIEDKFGAVGVERVPPPTVSIFTKMINDKKWWGPGGKR